MASKFWFVVTKQPSLELEQDEYVPTYFLQVKQLKVKAIGPPHLESDLSSLEPHQDFQIKHAIKREFCSNNKCYDISTGKGRLLFTGLQQNSICCFLNDPYQSIMLFNCKNPDLPVWKIEKGDFTGYLSKKLTFAISSSSGTKFGEIVRLAGFLEKPKYEITDANGELLFFLIESGIGSHSRHVLNKSGKVAHIEDRDGSCHLKLYQMCSVVEKALLLSLLLLLDLVKQDG